MGTGGLDQASKTKAGVWVVFSVSNDADSWIERASIEELKGESSVDKVLKKSRHVNHSKSGSGSGSGGAFGALSGRGNSSSSSSASGRGGGEECVLPGSSGSRVVYVVGLYKSSSVYPQLETCWFQPFCL